MTMATSSTTTKATSAPAPVTTDQAAPPVPGAPEAIDPGIQPPIADTPAPAEEKKEPVHMTQFAHGLLVETTDAGKKVNEPLPSYNPDPSELANPFAPPGQAKKDAGASGSGGSTPPADSGSGAGTKAAGSGSSGSGSASST